MVIATDEDRARALAVRQTTWALLDVASQATVCVRWDLLPKGAYIGAVVRTAAGLPARPARRSTRGVRHEGSRMLGFGLVWLSTWCRAGEGRADFVGPGRALGSAHARAAAGGVCAQRPHGGRTHDCPSPCIPRLPTAQIPHAARSAEVTSRSGDWQYRKAAQVSPQSVCNKNQITTAYCICSA